MNNLQQAGNGGFACLSLFALLTRHCAQLAPCCCRHCVDQTVRFSLAMASEQNQTQQCWLATLCHVCVCLVLNNLYLCCCQAVFDDYEEGDVVWCQDYHLMLLPALLKARYPKMKVTLARPPPTQHTEHGVQGFASPSVSTALYALSAAN